jgi:polysaccharide export outer membrane protein
VNLFVTIATMAMAALGGTPNEYHIGPGDVINVTVHGHDFGRTSFVVGASGEISFPYVGKVQVSDLTAFEAENTMERALADGYLVEPAVTVQIEQHRSQRVDVLGAVKKPGIYFLEGPTTLRQLVARAGTVVMDASSGRILVTRGSEQIVLNVQDLQGPDGDFPILRGDVVDVEQGSFVYLTGEVKKPGALPFTDGITVSQALIRAGGGSQLSRLAGSYILRDGERISVNLRKVLRGKQPDFMLQPGDQIVIPESHL